MPHKIDLTDSLEKIPVKIFATPQEGSLFVAKQIAALIREKEAAGKKCVIGLATGSSPKTLYADLVKMHKEEGLSFKNVITFNLDQYYPMDKDALQSYHYFMRKNLF
jgi:glucosamine-6-phosphate deaminase